jgi:hypothetical protein
LAVSLPSNGYLYEPAESFRLPAPQIRSRVVSGMAMPMMDVRVVRMRMLHWQVDVWMGMRRVRIDTRLMFVLVMLVVNVWVGVF